MGISIVIPVYNAEKYVKTAVESALRIKEIRQIILIEDRSPDNCLAICQALAEEYPDIVELHTHPEGKQKGAGASRNLGIEKVTQPFIAFLDADDYYLPQRFEHPLKIFKQRLDIDYVVTPSQLETDFLDQTEHYTMMGEEANNTSCNLFPALLMERYGYFDTNSILIRTESLKGLSKFFNPSLALHQDSELWLRIAYKLRGYAECVTLPGSVVRRHSKNRITYKNAVSLSLYWDTVSKEFQRRSLPNQLTNFIQLKKKYYGYLKENSVLSYWYLLCMRFYDSAVLSRIHHWDIVLENRPLQVEISQVLDNSNPALS